jgi:hypothetical protein
MLPVVALTDRVPRTGRPWRSAGSTAGGSDWHSLGRLCMRGSPSAPTEPTALQTMTAQRRVVWTWPAAFVPSIAG